MPEQRGVFHSLIGHDGAKTILRAALRSGDVDVLLEGVPASGKSVALLAIEEYVPGAKYVDAAGLTERGLRDAFADDPSVLLLDELDAAKNAAYEAMSMPMEQSRVTKDTAHESYDVNVSTQVFAACNDERDLPAHTADRFRTITFEEYSYDEYVDVCAVLLPSDVEWVNTEADARTVATEVHEAIESKSPRDARDAAKLAGRADRVETIARALADPKADVDSTPLLPGEVKRAQAHRGTHFGGADSDDSNGSGSPTAFADWQERACIHLADGADPSTSLEYQSGVLNCPRCQDEYGVDPDEERPTS